MTYAQARLAAIRARKAAEKTQAQAQAQAATPYMKTRNAIVNAHREQAQSTLENTSMNNMTRTITVAELPVITYQNVRVITTDLLASLYGATDKHIHDNYTNNKERFVEGKHFFKLEGEYLRQFKELHKPDNIGLVEISPRIRHLTLWTERGAARHAKILDTDAAWDVFAQLEDAYFNPREASSSANKQPALPNFADPVAAARAWADAHSPEGRRKPRLWPLRTSASKRRSTMRLPVRPPMTAWSLTRRSPWVTSCASCRA